MKIEIKVGSSTRTYTTRSGAAYIAVGSRPDSDIVIDDPGVSPIHVKFEHFAGRWSFTDQMSDTGTKHNGETTYSGELAEGDRIEIGGAALKVLDLLIEQDVSAKPSRPTDRSWQDEVKLSSSKPTAGYKRDVEREYVSSKGGGYTSSEDDEYKAKVEDGEEYHRRAAHAQNRQHTRQKGPSGAKKQQNAGAIVVVLGVMVMLGAGVAFAMFSAGDSDGAPSGSDSASTDDGSEPTSGKDRMPQQMEAEYKRQLDRLVDRSNETPPAMKYAAYVQFKEQIDAYRSHNLRWPLERAYTAIRLELFREIQERYSQDNGDVYDLEKENHYRLAIDRVRELKKYLEQTDLHIELAHSSEMDKYVARKLPELEEGNEWYIGECFGRVDEALQRNDYDSANKVLREVRGNAELDEDFDREIAAEIIEVMGCIASQNKGELPAKRAPFDRRKDKLPAAPKSTLLPNGDGSSYTAMNQLKTRLEKAWKAGEINEAECSFFGRKAKLQPKGEDYRMVLIVTHDYLKAGSREYRVHYAQHNLPPETTVSLYEAIKPTRDELLAMLLICFNEGLKEDAMRIACELWHADETAKEDLDQLLATKFGVEVPEGGFVEKDGKLVVAD